MRGGLVSRRVRILALSALEAALDTARTMVRHAIVREMLADTRESIVSAERELAEMRAARVPQNGWN